jgi:hypothetical protein
VVPFAVYFNDYLAVQYPLTDGAPARQQKNPPSHKPQRC